MLHGGYRNGVWLSIRRTIAGRNDLPKSFDLDLVTAKYEEQTRRATRTPRGPSPTTSPLRPPLRLVLPPPNVTGRLHIGHALTVTIEDALARQQRVHGGEATWLPGMDHAGIATQSVVERELWRREKRTRREMGREEFVERCRQFGESNARTIRSQMARMGATLEWEREYYTMDERFSSAVTRAFVTLHRDGLISRKKRFVHWSPALRSSLSDQEVDKEELPPGGVLSLPSADGKGRRDVKMGVMHTVKYELIGGGKSAFLPVATTRPETIYADVALAVHPSNPMVGEWRGRRVRNPLDGRELPIIVDEGVIADKGTGILKITPAHDRLDAAIADRHWAEIEAVVEGARVRSCIDECGRVVPSCRVEGEETGEERLDRFVARERVLERLAESGHLIESVEAVSTTVARCSRTGDIIEPRQTEQWFLECREMHAEAAAAVKDGRLSILPPSQAERLLDWFSYEEPWCLSRQLVWGHRIPAWRVEGTSDWIVERTEAEARENAQRSKIRQDEDVLDTWFSSGLVPLVCGGWMDSSAGPMAAPPLSLLETGTDILGFWVARMVALTMRLSGGQVPFPRVVLHGLVRDSEGRKMSKSIGNVVDPLDVIDGISLQKMEERLAESALGEAEKVKALSSLRAKFPSGIPRCGPDSLRFALLRHDVLAADIPIDIGTLAAEGLRFCNKLWNLAAYAEQVRAMGGREEGGEEDVMDAWIRSRLATALVAVERHMEEVQVHLAFSAVHHFILGSLADVYVESTKDALWSKDEQRLRQISRTMDGVMGEALRQLSVFMPFVSNFLYERIRGESVYDESLKYSSSWIDPQLETTVSEILAVAASARSLKQKLGVPNRTKFQGVLHSSLSPTVLQPLLPLLGRLSAVEIERIQSLAEESPAGFEVTSVPGHDSRLALKVEDCHREEMRKVLEEKMARAVEKRVLYLQKAAKYEQIASEERARGEKRARAAEKNEKKREQAASVAESAAREEERLRQMIATK